jgi:hypothetical protein
MKVPARVLIVCLPLAACDNTASLTLAASGALDVQDVRLAVTQVQLQDEAGDIVTVDSADTGVHDLRDFNSGTSIAVLSGAGIPSGRYTGVALTFEANSAQVVTADGSTFPISMPADPVFSPTDFSVLRHDSAPLWAGLDLRLSLSDRSGTDGTWRLVPHLAIANLDTAATLSGAIAAAVGNSENCVQGRGNHDGAAVYAWAAANVTPHDESPDAEPARATVEVTWNSDGSGRYAFPHLAPGAYTVALGCVSAQDDPQSAQGQVFAASGQITLDEDGDATLDFSVPD